MFDRLPAAPTLFLLLSLSLAACAGSEGPTGPSGPTGPAGEAGPGTRIVLSGTINVAEAPDSVLRVSAASASAGGRHTRRSPGGHLLLVTG